MQKDFRVYSLLSYSLDIRIKSKLLFHLQETKIEQRQKYRSNRKLNLFKISILFISLTDDPLEYPNLWHSFVLLASQQQKFRGRSATLKKEHIKSLSKLVGPEVRSFHCDSHNSKSFHEWPTSPEIFAVPQLGWAIKKLRFSFQLPKRTSCNDNDSDDDGTNYKTTR